jgi:ATP-dependent Clp protease ATP-binding subunit ClpC
MFLGPSGTGKTLCAQVLSDILFPHQQKAFMRFDMSEYVESHSVSKLVGSPPGYVGFGSGGLLTNFVKENPYSILLFDEIEKANETVHNIMLQMLDNGTITDTNNDTINFNNTIIIFTSNSITEFKEKTKLGFLDNKVENNSKNTQLFNKLKEHFKQEFLNRLDYIVLFENLKDDSYNKIIDLEILKLSKDYLTPLNIVINDDVKKYILEKLDIKNARYITKIIQNEIIDNIIQQYLEKKLDINNKINISIKDTQLLFEENKELNGKKI